MGLFDFLKKKEQPNEITQPEKPIAEENKKQPYFGDLSKTGILHQLVQTPPTERDERWQQNFLANISEASFCCGDPQVVTGPDGFPYFQLFLPEPNKSFQCYVIDKMKDDFLLASGFGVVINPTSNSADWVLSYGDILNLHLNQAFYTTTDTPFSKQITDETITENEQVMIGQPSEQLLPQQTRKLIADFLKANGFAHPKVLLMMRHGKDGKDVTQDLVFNLTPENFSDENTYRMMMQTIGWYLPRHYSFVGMREESLENDFMPL